MIEFPTSKEVKKVHIIHNFYCTPDIYTVHPEDGHRSDQDM
jgi:hypothetical protein